jgi:hypothetical protein
MPRKKTTIPTPAIDAAGNLLPPPPPPTKDQHALALRRKVKLFYDIQEMRLHTEGRLTPKATTNPIELHPDDLAKLQQRLDELALAEKHALADVEEHVESVPFYVACIAPHRKDRYKALGATSWGVILSSFDIVREDTPSKMWSFAGLAPKPARRCTTCSIVCVEVDAALAGELGGHYFKHPKPAGGKCHLAGLTVNEIQTFPSGKSMRPVAGEKLPYNAWLRSKLCGVFAANMIKLNSPYRKFYDDYKHRKASAGWGCSDGHRHNAAMRFMIKQLLLDIWREWRAFEGLPVRPSYQEEYLGHTHGGSLQAPQAEASAE